MRGTRHADESLELRLSPRFRRACLARGRGGAGRNPNRRAGPTGGTAAGSRFANSPASAPGFGRRTEGDAVRLSLRPRQGKAGHDPALVVRNAARPAPGGRAGSELRDTEAEMDALTETQPASQIEDEDVYDLIVDCQSFIAEIMERRLPKSVERQGTLLLGRLNASLDWQTVH
jgi:hypothetical protein